MKRLTILLAATVFLLTGCPSGSLHFGFGDYCYRWDVYGRCIEWDGECAVYDAHGRCTQWWYDSNEYDEHDYEEDDDDCCEYENCGDFDDDDGCDDDDANDSFDAPPRPDAAALTGAWLLNDEANHDWAQIVVATDGKLTGHLDTTPACELSGTWLPDGDQFAVVMTLTGAECEAKQTLTGTGTLAGKLPTATLTLDDGEKTRTFFAVPDEENRERGG